MLLWKNVKPLFWWLTSMHSKNIPGKFCSTEKYVIWPDYFNRQHRTKCDAGGKSVNLYMKDVV